MEAPGILFSDLDGTFIHYDWTEWGHLEDTPNAQGLWRCTAKSADGGGTGRHSAVLKLPPSTSGAQGVISVATLQLFAALRALGVRIVLISGARLATVMQRLPFLPAADAIVCESGGRIFYPPPAAAAAAGASSGGWLPTAAPLQEDLAWRSSHDAAAGPWGQDGLPPGERAGVLWRQFEELEGQGVRLDCTSYTTAFRVRAIPEALEQLQSQLPPELASAVNLGAGDVFPATSGKENAARYLMQRYDVPPQRCAFMCDDNNDLQLAAAVGRAYLPGITAASVQRAVDADPSHFYVAKERGVFGTEECLRCLLAEWLAAAEGWQLE